MTGGGPRHPVGRGVAVAVAAVLGGSCVFGAGGQGLPAPPGTVEVTMHDYRFDFRPPSRAGRTVFHATNVGRVKHELRLLPLTDDIAPIEQQVQGDDRREVPSFGRIHPRPPGGSGVFAVDLTPGRRYALICFVYDPDGEVHARKGMAAEFRAPGTPPETSPTSPAAPPPAEPPPS